MNVFNRFLFVLLVFFVGVANGQDAHIGDYYYQKLSTDMVFVDAWGAHQQVSYSNPHFVIPLPYNDGASGLKINYYKDGSFVSTSYTGTSGTGKKQYSLTADYGSVVFANDPSQVVSGGQFPYINFYEYSAQDMRTWLPPPSAGPPMDLYTYSITIINDATNYYIDAAAWIEFSSGLPDLLFDLDDIKNHSISGSFEVEPDSGTRFPLLINVQLYNSLFNQLGQIDYSFHAVGSTPSGGTHYEMLYYQHFEIGEVPARPTDPETPPMPIDPINPPVVENPDSPSGPVPGGDTNPTVDPDYEAFRNAMESALDLRELSADQLRAAFRQAMIEQKLSNVTLKEAFAAALAQMGVTEQKNRNAFQNALASQGLSGSNLGNHNFNAFSAALDTHNLTADRIGESVASHMGGTNSNAGIISKLGEISDKLSGESVGGLSATNATDWVLGTNTVETGMGSTASNMVGKADGLIGFVEDWFGNFFVLDLPTSIGQQTLFILEIPDGAPGVGSIFPSQVVVDLSSFHGLGVVRGIEVACLHLFGVFCAVRIYKSCW